MTKMLCNDCGCHFLSNGHYFHCTNCDSDDTVEDTSEVANIVWINS